MDPLIANKELKCLSNSIEDYPGGIIIPVDKPYRWTSADVIRKVKYAAKRHFGKKNLKVGHAGTLDPLATGVLLVCIGNATKLAETLQKHDKEYIAGITFGATTPSYDLEKEIDKLYPHDGVSEESVRAVLPSFLGEQEQIAPLFSAKSVDGVRAYELARKKYREAMASGESFDHADAETLARQRITISSIELLRYCPDGIPASEIEAAEGASSRINVTDNSSLHLPHAEIRVACSKGTYIRALARDLGEALGTGAHLDSLCRTRNGGFSVEDALTVDEATSLLSAN
ncbi:MAG: tRNA pseudouridine(55) synthase TruB [Bacteroidales bacterium]|nr:tRNA pseudouridine(55) synthase TruB [Bacteroidales bacterium]